jgi:hypothetical protein
VKRDKHVIKGGVCEPKNILVLFFICYAVFFSFFAFAFDNEPTGFRGIEWWTHISKLPEMKLLDDKDVVRLYVREEDPLEIGDAKLQDIWYVFVNDRFSKVIITYTSDSNHEALKRTLCQVFGAGYTRDAEGWQHCWLGVRVRIIMEYDKASSLGTLEFNAKGASYYRPEIDGCRKVVSAVPGL